MNRGKENETDLWYSIVTAVRVRGGSRHNVLVQELRVSVNETQEKDKILFISP